MKELTNSVMLLCAGLALLSCGGSERVAGNSANTGNAQAAGRILQPSGAPAAGARVVCLPDSLDPWDGRSPGWMTSTDSAGRFLCSDLPLGRVGITADVPGSGLSRWRDDTVGSVPGVEATDTLASSGRLRIALSPGATGTVYLTGWDRSVVLHGESELEIADIPAGWSGSVKIAPAIHQIKIVDSGLHVPPGATDSAGFTRRSLNLRVPLAGGLTSVVTQLPLLVRLDSSWNGFGNTLADGSDLRLSTADGKSLPLTMAQWDRASRKGSVWTILDSLKAPGDSVDLVLSWGLPVPATSVAPAFTASRGWLAAWPLGDTGTEISERLGAHPGSAKATESVIGVTGKASRFDGRLSEILVPGSSTGALDLPEGGPYTMSCWARLKDFGTSRFVMGRGEQGSNLKFQKTFDKDTNSWLAKDFRTSPAGGYYTMARADTGVWTHLAMTVSGKTVSLYVNGKKSVVDSGFDGDAIGRKAELFAIGVAVDTAGATTERFFGDLAEVWVQGATRSPDWIRLVAENQAPGAPAVKLR